MNRILLLTLLACVLFSCAQQSTSQNIIDEKYEPSDEELFAACAELRGIGQFVIDKTTFAEAVRDADIRAGYFGEVRSSLYNGFWGKSFWGEYQNCDGFKEAEFMEKIGTIKQLAVYSGVNLNGFEFGTFDMAFYDNKLVAINFWPKDRYYELLRIYIEKYGPGRGYLYESNTGSKSAPAVYESIKNEERLWSNGSVALKYDNHEEFTKRQDGTIHSDHKHNLMIYSVENYPKFVEEYQTMIKDSCEQKMKIF